MQLSGAATGRSNDGAELRPDDRRPPPLVRETRRDEPHDPDRPRTTNDGRSCVVDGVRRGARLGDCGLHEVAASQVCRLEDDGEALGLGRVVGEQQARGVECLPHPASRVQARREAERQGLQVHVRRRRAGLRQQGGETRPRGRPQLLQPELHDRAILAEDGREIRHGADRGEIRERERGVAEEEARQREGDAAPGEPPVRVVGVGAMRIDDRQRRRQDRRDLDGGP